MARPNQDLAMENILATLRAIRGQAPYLSTVEKVERRHKEVTQIPSQEMPFCGAREGDENFTGHHGFYKAEFPVEIQLQVRGDDEDDARRKVNLLFNDIVHAFNVDHTRDGAAYETLLVGANPTEIHDRTIARKTIVWMIFYVRNFTNEYNGGMP